MYGVSGCHILNLPKVERQHSELVFAEQLRHIPFEIKRVYFLTNFDLDTAHVHHAHKQLEQVYVCARGALSITLSDATSTRTVTLDDNNQALYIGGMVWRSVIAQTPDTVLLVLASQPYDEQDYIRSWDDYVEYYRQEFE